MAKDNARPERYIPWHVRDAIRRRAKVTDEARKRGKRAKKKGQTGETEAARRMEELTGIEWEARGRDKDILPKDSHSFWYIAHHFDVKRYKAIGMTKWCEQAERDAARHGKGQGIVLWRQDTKPGVGERRPPWRVSLKLTAYVADQMELNAYRDKYGPLQEGKTDA